MKPANILKNVLQVDAKHRNLDDRLFEDDSDIFKLDTICSGQKWLFEYPTIVSTPFKLKITKSCDFRNVMKKTYNYFNGINYDHIFIAGGFVGNVLMGLPINDVDMFVFDLDEADADLLVFDTINIIINNIKKIKGGVKYEIVNSKNSITISLSNIIKIQIILRLYSSKSEILHGFDLGSSAIGFDGKSVYLTSLGKFSYEFGCNIVDPTRRSTTYEERLIKYLKRGFKIIMPKFDMDVIDKSQILYKIDTLVDLPFLKVVVKNVKYNKMEFVQNVTKFNKVVDYCDFNIRKRICVDNDLVTSFKTFMNIDQNIYIVNSKDKVDVITKIIDYKRESQSNKSSVSRFINNNFVARPNWLTTNPGTQLSGSFNPIIENVDLWYGKYYKKHKKTLMTSCIDITRYLIKIFLIILITFWLCLYLNMFENA
jgi:hypothetical protein